MERKTISIDGIEVSYWGRKQCSYPYGKAMLPRHEWWLTWTPKDSEYERHIKIMQFEGQSERFIVENTYPTMEAKTFEAIIRRVVTEEFTQCT